MKTIKVIPFPAIIILIIVLLTNLYTSKIKNATIAALQDSLKMVEALNPFSDHPDSWMIIRKGGGEMHMAWSGKDSLIIFPFPFDMDSTQEITLHRVSYQRKDKP